MVDKLKIPILPNNQLALLADKIHRMKSLGEIDILVVEQETGHVILRLRALVMENLHMDCYGGQTFHLDNGVVDDVSSSSISLHHGKFKLKQGNKYGNLVAHPPPVFSVQQIPNRLINLAAVRPDAISSVSDGFSWLQTELQTGPSAVAGGRENS